MNDPASEQMDVDVNKPNADLNKTFHIHKDLDTDMKQVEDQVAELDLKGLSITTKEKKTVQFSLPLFAISSKMKMLKDAKEKALSDAASTGSLASKLKKKKKKSRLQIGKIYTSKRKLNFSNDDGQDDENNDVKEKDLDLSLNEAC